MFLMVMRWVSWLPHDRMSKSIPEFKVPSEIALELLMAANYLDM